MKKFLLGFVAAVFALGIVAIPVRATLYNMTVRIVDSAGNVINGSASATTANYNETVRVVDSNGNVVNGFGGATIKLVAQSAINHASGATSNSVSVPAGISAGDCLLFLGVAVQKPTSVISCPSGFTQVSVGGQLTDGTYQPQAILCSRVVTGTESASYSLTWSGSAYTNAVMRDISGLSECTTPDDTYAAANASSVGMLGTAPTPPYPVDSSVFNIYAIGCNGNFGASPVMGLVNNTATAAAFGDDIGSSSVSVYASSNSYFAIAGALMH